MHLVSELNRTTEISTSGLSMTSNLGQTFISQNRFTVEFYYQSRWCSSVTVVYTLSLILVEYF